MLTPYQLTEKAFLALTALKTPHKIERCDNNNITMCGEYFSRYDLTRYCNAIDSLKWSFVVTSDVPTKKVEVIFFQIEQPMVSGGR